MEYAVTYKNGRNTKEKFDGILDVNLEDYQQSYAEDVFHLSQYYPANMVHAMIKDNKIGFLREIIRKKFGNHAFISKGNCQELIKEIDRDVKARN